MKKILSHPILIIFAFILLAVSLINFLSPVRSFSELENRYLSKRPNFSLQKFFSSNYSAQYE